MLNFNFYNPTQIVFGEGEIKQLNDLVPANARVLITYGGGSVKRNGVYDAVMAELNKADRTVFEFGGIPANPKLDVLMGAIEIVRAEKIDFLLAVGGGSVMDGTKFIAIAANAKEFEGRERDMMNYGFGPVPVESGIPFGTVVTLPATGSEMNNGAVISDGEDKLPVFSAFGFPQFSIIDPTYTYTLPKTQVANGVVDAFIHTVEQYVTFPAEARFQDRTAEGILNTLVEVGPKTVADPTDYDARSNLVLSATMALNGLIGAGAPQDWTTHMIGHEMTALTGIDHAKTLAMIQPAVWKVRLEQKLEKLAQFGERVWAIQGDDPRAVATEAIAKTEAFFESLEMPTKLSAYDLDESVIEPLLKQLEKHQLTALSERGDLGLDEVRQILTAAL